MMAPLASESLDLDPANPSSLDVITATRAGTATYTDASGNIQTASPNTVRVDHVDGVPMMLIEPAATNTARYSELAVNYNYNSGITKETTNELAPNGQASAFKITPDGSNITVRSGSSYTYSGNYNAGDVVSVSMWLKTDGYDYFVRVGGFFGSEGALFDTIDGSNVSNQANVISASSEDYGNGWFRYKVTYTFQNSINNNYLYAGLRLYKRDASGNPTSWDATGETTGILVYGTQFELGSHATSYIPTDNNIGGVTRAADKYQITGSDFTNFFNSGGDGTFYAEFTTRNISDRQIFVAGGNNGNSRYFYSNEGSSYMASYDGANGQYFDTENMQTGLNRVVVTYNSSQTTGSLNAGTTQTKPHNGNLGNATEFNIGNGYGTSAHLNGHIKRLIYWPYHSDNL